MANKKALFLASGMTGLFAAPRKAVGEPSTNTKTTYEFKAIYQPAINFPSPYFLRSKRAKYVASVNNKTQFSGKAFVFNRKVRPKK